MSVVEKIPAEGGKKKPSSELIKKAISLSAGKEQPIGSEPETTGFERAEAEQEKRVTAALLNEPIKVGRFQIRRFTLSSIALLKEINSPLITGVDVNKVPNIILDVVKMILLQTLPLQEALKLARDREALDIRALEFGDTIDPSETKELVEDTLAALQKATTGQVIATPPTDGKSGKGLKQSKKEAEPGNDSSRPSSQE